MNTTATATATYVPGTPVVARWGHGVPGVNVGGRDQAQTAYATGNGSDIVYAAGESTFGTADVLHLVARDAWTHDMLMEAAGVARQTADAISFRITNRIGRHGGDPEPEVTLAAVNAARDARDAAWAWTVLAGCVRDGFDFPDRAVDIVTTTPAS